MESGLRAARRIPMRLALRPILRPAKSGMNAIRLAVPMPVVIRYHRTPRMVRLFRGAM